MTHAYRTRPLEGDDLEAIARIEEQSFPNAWPRRRLWRWLRHPSVFGRVILLARDENEVVGFFLCVREHERYYLANLAVATAHRRRGAGRFMLRALELLALEDGALRIELDVRETNLPAQLLYRDAGYRATHIRSGFYEGEDGYRMERTLRRPRVEAMADSAGEAE